MSHPIQSAKFETAFRTENQNEEERQAGEGEIGEERERGESNHNTIVLNNYDFEDEMKAFLKSFYTGKH